MCRETVIGDLLEFDLKCVESYPNEVMTSETTV